MQEHYYQGLCQRRRSATDRICEKDNSIQMELEEYMNKTGPIKLLKAIDKIDDQYIKMALKDLFALGCYLHLKGEKSAAEKTIITICRAVGFNDYIKIIENLNNNEKEYAEKIMAHSEILNLLHK